MDVCARALLVAAKLLEEETLSRAARRALCGMGRAGGRGRSWRGGQTLAAIADAAEQAGIDPQPRSGRQERLENAVARAL